MTELVEDIERYAREHTQLRGELFAELRAYAYEHIAHPHMQVGRVKSAPSLATCSIRKPTTHELSPNSTAV